MDNTDTQAAFLAALQRLTAELGGLRHAILGQPRYRARLFFETRAPTTQEALAEAVSDISYVDGQDPKSTKLAPGLVTCSEDLAKRIQLVNHCKRAFLRERKAYQAQAGGKAVQSLLNSHPGNRNDRVNQALKRAGAARINLKEADRLIVVLPETTDRVAYTWFRRGRTIVRVQRDELMEKLATRAAKGEPVQDDLLALAAIAPDEPLALVRLRSPTLRANIRQTGEKTYRARNAVLPIFVIRRRPEDPLPEHNEPEPAGLSSRRLERNDQRLEEKPLLRTYAVYRYTALDAEAG